MVGRDKITTTHNVTQIIQQAQSYKFETLHELRPIKETFTGRTREIAELIETAERDANNEVAAAMSICSAITGLGGVGKSELANVVAHALRPRYPDAQLWLDMGAHSVSARSPQQALERVLHTLNPKARLPDDPHALRALYVQVLSGQRGLVVIDDVRDDDDLAWLLPPPGCLTLITSRKALATGTPLRLGALPRPEATALLRHFRATLSDADADDLAGLCADLPVALNITGSYLKTQPSLSAARYCAALRETPFAALKFGGDEKNDVSRVFNHSANQLNAQHHAAWCALSVMPADFDRAAGVAVCGLPDDDGLNHPLDVLVELSLLTYDPQTERFGWHDLLQKFAAGLGDEGTMREARMRHVAYYTFIGQSADHLYQQGNEKFVIGLQIFDRERVHIEALIDYLTSDRQISNRQQLGIEVVNAVIYVSGLRFNSSMRISWLSAQLEMATEINDNANIANAASNLGFALLRQNQVDAAEEMLRKALAIFSSINDKIGEARALSHLGIVYRDKDQLSPSTKLFKRRLRMSREINDLPGECDGLYNLAQNNLLTGSLKAALSGFHKALNIANRLGDLLRVANANFEIGNTYYLLGKRRKAIPSFEQSLSIFSEIGDRQNEAATLTSLGKTYAELAEPNKAINFFERCVVLYRKLGNQRSEAYVLFYLGYIYTTLAEVGKAVGFYEQSLLIYHEIGDQQNEAAASWSLGLLYESQGDLQRAVDLMQVCVDYETELGHPDAVKGAAYVAQLREKLRGAG